MYKNSINNVGYSYIWLNFNKDINYFPMFKQRLRDQFMQIWTDMLKSQNKLEYYSKFKKDFKFEKYFDVVDNDKHRIALSKFRLCAHSLEIETGRYNKTPRENRICKLCNTSMVESEYHFLCICPMFRDLRVKYNIPVSLNNINTFVSLLSSNSVRKIRCISKFIHHAMIERNEYLRMVAS